MLAWGSCELGVCIGRDHTRSYHLPLALCDQVGAGCLLERVDGAAVPVSSAILAPHYLIAASSVVPAAVVPKARDVTHAWVEATCPCVLEIR